MGEISEIKIVSLDDLKRAGCIYFDKIETGFQYFQSNYLVGEPDVIERAILKYIERNGWENSFVDFYYGTLLDQQKGCVHEYLSDDQIKWIENQHIGQDQLYFQLSPELFSITFQLSIREILFSTFYFSKYPSAIWGNYNNKFPVFYSNTENFFK